MSAKYAGLVDINAKRFYKNGVMRAKECAAWCTEYNNKAEKETDRKGLHMTCCQWTPETRQCDYRLGAYLAWSGTTTSQVFAPGAKLISADGLGFNAKNDVASTAGDL